MLVHRPDLRRYCCGLRRDLVQVLDPYRHRRYEHRRRLSGSATAHRHLMIQARPWLLGLELVLIHHDLRLLLHLAMGWG